MIYKHWWVPFFLIAFVLALYTAGNAQGERLDLPEGFKDLVWCDYGISEVTDKFGNVTNRLLTINVQESLFSDKTKRVAFISRADPRKSWEGLKPFAEKLLQDIMNMNGVTDVAATSYQIAVSKAPRFHWDDLTPVILDRVKQTLGPKPPPKRKSLPPGAEEHKTQEKE